MQDSRRTTETALGNPTVKTCQGVKLRVNGETTSDHDIVMQTWVDHFEDIGRSRADEKAPVASANSEMQDLITESFVNVETILDVPFIAEEIEAAHQSRESWRG